ncbi:MAG: hypothetical protein KF770_22225 [Anaerolineae bacterium]|nr:hypothetical protein [Anaerolineae bacterium]
MQVSTYEGIVENGKIRLKTAVQLPESMTVYVIVPDLVAKPVVHVYSPRLAHPEQAKDFKKEIIEVLPDAEL